MINMGYFGVNIASYGPGEPDKVGFNIGEAPAASSGYYAIHEISEKYGIFLLFMNDWWWHGDAPIDTTLIVMWFYGDFECVWSDINVWQHFKLNVYISYTSNKLSEGKKAWFCQVINFCSGFTQCQQTYLLKNGQT